MSNAPFKSAHRLNMAGADIKQATALAQQAEMDDATGFLSQLRGLTSANAHSNNAGLFSGASTTEEAANTIAFGNGV